MVVTAMGSMRTRVVFLKVSPATEDTVPGSENPVRRDSYYEWYRRLP